MNLFKYPLLPEGEDYTAEYSSLNHCLNRSLDVGGCTLFVCEKGNADISLNFKHYKFKVGQILISFGGMIIIPSHVSADFSAFRLSLSTTIVDEVLIKSSSDLNDFFYFNPVLPTTKEQRNLLKGWEQQVLWILRPENSSNARKMMSNTLWNFFLAIKSIVGNTQALSASNYKMSRAWLLINKFANLLLEHVYVNKSVNFYAKELCITPYYLYKVVAKELNTSPKEVIDFYVISELKILLSTTDLSIKEISERLNFEDPSYLNRFFRRQVGVTLTEFRENNT